jgi:transcriptional regulator with XRE-family HTH domain
MARKMRQYSAKGHMVSPPVTPLSEDELGRRLAAARGYARMTLQELAEQMDTYRGTLSGYEKGAIPSLKRAGLIEGYREASKLPPEFFSIDFKDLPEMHAAWRQVRDEISTPEDLAAALERDEVETLPPDPSEPRNGEREL